MVKTEPPVTFEKVAEKLHENGYLPVPVVGADKRPAIANWLDYEFSKDDLPKFSGYSCGIITGKVGPDGYAVTGIDVDCTSGPLVKEFTEWIFSNYPETCVRVGNPPKTLLLYRMSTPGVRKITGRRWVDKVGNSHRVEVQGLGQEFVAFGIHQKTKAPYQWPSIGDPLEMSAFTLPEISEKQSREIVEKFDEFAKQYGMQEYHKDPAFTGDISEEIAGYQLPLGLTKEETAVKLKPIPAYDRETWIKVGMALHHEYQGGQVGLDLWDAWSATAPEKYVPGECIKKWQSFGARKRVNVTAAYIVKLYKDAQHAIKAEERRIALKNARAAIQQCNDPQELLYEVVPEIAAVASDNIAAEASLKTAVQTKYKRLTSEHLDKPTVNKLFRAPLQTVPVYDMTEIGNGERLKDAYGDKIMYAPELDKWFRWDGSRWCACVPEYVLRLAKHVVSGITKETEFYASKEDRSSVVEWARKSATAKMLDNMVKLVRKEPGIMVSHERLDADTRYLGVLNGAVDLHTGLLLEPDRKRRVTLNTGINYDPKAQCPVFIETVQDAFFEDQSMVDFLQRLIGYTLLGQPEKEEVLVIPEGRGANGKSTIFNAIYHCLGAYAKFASADTFVSAKGGASSGAAREDVLRLAGARFVYITEFEENGVLREAFIKGLTGGEAVPARGVYSRHTVEVQPTWVSFMPTNHLPIIKGEDEGIWRRIITIPFRRDFSKDVLIEKDVHRKDKLKAEAPGVLRWCVDGVLKYLEQGLNPPPVICKVVKRYRQHMDLLSDWLEECCETGPEYAARSRDLWSSFVRYSEAEGTARYINSSNALGRRLRDRGFNPIKSSHGIRGCGYLGIRLKEIDFKGGVD